MITVMGFQFRRPTPQMLLLEAGYTVLFAALLMVFFAMYGISPYTVLVNHSFQSAVACVGASHFSVSLGLIELNCIKGKVAFIFMAIAFSLIIIVL